MKAAFGKKKSGELASESELTRVAKECLLPISEVKIWFEHLANIQRNRKRGAQQAAETRRAKKNKSLSEQCSICREYYEEETEETQYWIECALCKWWFHFECVGVCVGGEPDVFNCSSCQQAM